MANPQQNNLQETIRNFYENMADSAVNGRILRATEEWLEDAGLLVATEWFARGLLLCITLFLAAAGFWVTRRVMRYALHKVTEKTQTQWDDVLLRRRGFLRLSHFVPGSILLYGLPASLHGIPKLPEISQQAAIIYLVVILCLVGHFLSRTAMIKVVQGFARKSQNPYDDILIAHRVFRLTAHLTPGLLLHLLSPVAFSGQPGIILFFQRAALVYMIVVGVLVANALLNALEGIYNHFAVSRRVPIRGFIQVAKLVFLFAAFILTLALLMDREPWFFLSGLGAVTAVLMLVFKDAILGFVAGIQLAANNMVSPGDWIEMPKYGADGDVIDVNLTTVKVRNWDKTITTIPTYALVSDSFINWRGMAESGGRRIKRAIHIDMQSVQFCTPEMLQRFEKIQYISDYIKKRQEEIENFNRENNVDESIVVNGRRMTNIGTLRAYIVSYLRNHPMIHQDMTFLVRHLPPSEKGLPIEIYVFSKDQVWANYEAIQADIFDHLLAIIPHFDLRVFQNPTGKDFQRVFSPERG